MKAYCIDTQTPMTAEELNSEGIIYLKLPIDPDIYLSHLNRFMEERGYVTQDEVNMSPALPNYEEMSHKFAVEHYHPGDEVRFILQGGGVWEIRSQKDEWIRVVVEPGDLIVVPDGRYHRFYLTDEKWIKCIRLFKDHEGWKQVYRRDIEKPVL